MTETNRPINESGPYFLKISSNNPVEADDETSRINVNGTASFGNPNIFVIGVISLPKKSNAPDSRKIPTATINPISVGKI